jgi:hypothetical protein
MKEPDMAQDVFFEHPRTRAATSAGEVELPILYRDLSAVYAFFLVERGRVAALLAGKPLAAVPVVGGRAVAGLAFFEYRETSIGFYREVALAIPVVPAGTAPRAVRLLHLLRPAAHADVGYHVLDLPVTTAIADAAGRELWGLPKFVTGIDLDLREGGLRGAVHDPGGGEPIVTLEGRPGPGVSMPAMDLVFFSERGGELLRAVVDARGRARTSLGRGLAVRVGASAHPMARRLRDLGLDGARPLAVQVGERLQTVLHAGAPVARARAA